MKRKVIGYGYKLSNESISDALSHYVSSDLNKNFHLSAESVNEFIMRDKKDKNIGRSAKPKIFRVVVEVLDGDQE